MNRGENDYRKKLDIYTQRNTALYNSMSCNRIYYSICATKWIFSFSFKLANK